MKLFDKMKKVTKSNLTTLKHYKLIFKTVDGEIHYNDNVCYVDESTIRYSALDSFLLGTHFLKDNSGVQYPIQNVVSIQFELDEVIDNVKVKGIQGLEYYAETWYTKNMIETI